MILHCMITEMAPTFTLHWTQAALAQFEYIKSQMCQLCTLAVFNPKAMIILYMDAYVKGLRYMLMQLQKDRTKTVTPFSFCNLSKAQQIYHIIWLEVLAFIWTLSHFHLYLSVQSFLWRTDHRALKFIFDAFKISIPELQRYKLITDGYQFITEWILGARMIANSIFNCILH